MQYRDDAAATRTATEGKADHADDRPPEVPEEVELLEDGEDGFGGDDVRRTTGVGGGYGAEESWEDAEARLAEDGAF